jgi:L-threonylcarbamoyladenylate synthase
MATPTVDPTPGNLREAARCIAAGGVVLVPSDTNLAIAADATNPAAIDRVYRIKGRSHAKPLTLFVRDPDDWRRYGRPDPAGVAPRLIDALWPGPPFVIVEATDRVPDRRLRHEGTVSIGCIAHPVWREVTAHLDVPLAITSANRSGTVPDDTLIDRRLARDHVGERVDLILAVDPPPGATRATTIVDATNGPRIHRPGDLSAATLNAALDDGAPFSGQDRRRSPGA